MKYTAYINGVGKTEMTFDSWLNVGTYPSLTTVKKFETKEDAEAFASEFPKYTKPNVQKVTGLRMEPYFQVSFYFSNINKTTGGLNETAVKRAKRIFNEK